MPQKKERLLLDRRHTWAIMASDMAIVSIFTKFAAAAASDQGGGGYSVKPNIKMVNSNSYTKSSEEDG